jgi:TATA-box binding protein (TBP) (component of TFIID and TFIIIB)
MTIPFEKIAISTQTIICKTNWRINLNELFNILPITEYKVYKKKRGRKPKNFVKNDIQTIKDGSIVTLKFGEKMKGINIKKNKKGFRNSLTMVMQTNGKFINVKISKNGKFQITGSKNSDNAQKCIEYLKKYVDVYDNNLQNSQKILSVKCNSNPEAIFLDVMTNIHFSIGFIISRENLDKYMNLNTKYYSLLETSFGYTGVNIKIPLDDISDLPVNKMVLKNGEWIKENITYAQYISTLTYKEQEKERCKSRYTTILVFQSGNCILSSLHKICMKHSFDEFQRIIKDCKNLIEEKPFVAN